MTDIYNKTINEIIQERKELIAKNEALVKGRDLKLNQFIDAELLLEIYTYLNETTIFSTTGDKNKKIKCLEIALRDAQSAIDSPDWEKPYFKSRYKGE